MFVSIWARGAMPAVAVTTLLMGGAPPAVASLVLTLTFATWNVCNLDCPYPAPSWDVRRDRVQRALVSESGYSSPVIEDDRCSRTDGDTTARLLFRNSSVAQLDFGRSVPSAGSRAIRDGAGALLAISADSTALRSC